MTMNTYEFHWLAPQFLSLLLMPALMLALCYARKPSSRDQQTSQSKTLYPLLLRGSYGPCWRRYLSLMVLWTSLTLALAGPYLSKPEHQLSTLASANIVVILDISPSMSVQDVKPNRLHHARLQLNRFIRELESVRIGLVSFSANAYTVLPLTRDQEAVIHFIDIMAPELVTVPGSNLARALELAKEVLNEKVPDQAEPTPGLALLISDGEIHDNAAWKAATKLAASGHQLMSLGVGSLVGGPVPLPNGQLVREQNQIITSQLRPDVLKSLAQSGQGEYLTLTPQAWRSLKDRINTLQQSQYQEQHQANISIALYPLMIAIGLMSLFVHALRRPEALLLFILLPGLYSPHVDAAPWDEALAYSALKQGNYSQALTQYQKLDNYNGLMGQGVSAYRLKQWQIATKSFQQAIALAPSKPEISSAYYNLGNSLAQQNNLDAAQQAFEHALSLMPTHIGAAHNLALIKTQQMSLSGENNKPESPSRLNANQHDAALNLLSTEDQQRNSPPTEPPTYKTMPTQTKPSEAQAALAQWISKQGSTSSKLNSRQQLHMINDDSAAMLRQRFGIEDVNTTGIVEEKPW